MDFSVWFQEYFLTNLEIQVNGEIAFGDKDIPILDMVYAEKEKYVRRLYSVNEQEYNIRLNFCFFVHPRPTPYPSFGAKTFSEAFVLDIAGNRLGGEQTSAWGGGVPP